MDKSFLKKTPDFQGVLTERRKKGLCCTNIPASPQLLLCTARGKAISCTLWDTMNIAEKNKLGMLVILQIRFSSPWVKHQGLCLCTKWHLGAKTQGGTWSLTLSDPDAAKPISGSTSPLASSFSSASYKQAIADYWQTALIFWNRSCMGQALEGTIDASTVYESTQILPLSSSMEHQGAFCHQRLQAPSTAQDLALSVWN